MNENSIINFEGPSSNNTALNVLNVNILRPDIQIGDFVVMTATLMEKKEKYSLLLLLFVFMI